MDAGVPQRIGLAATVAVAAAAAFLGLILAADSATSRAPGEELRPDLVVERPAELYLVSHKRKVRLRVSNTIANTGTGPLEIKGGLSGDPECFIPGKPEGRHTLQNIYEDSADPDSPGFFLRGPGHDTSFNEVTAGCSRFHLSHNHWHFDNFARYTLLRERNGRVIDRSRKVSFCVIDTGQPYPGLDGSPASPFYPSPTPTCSETSVDGLSIGWEDTYGASLPGQVIDVSGAKRGRYCLVLEVDPPTGGGDTNGNLIESNENNNVRTIKLKLRPRRGLLKRLGSNCRAA